MFVNQEETTGSGSTDCLDWFVANYKHKYLHVAGLLPEPTGLQSIEIGHKGNAFIKLTVAGESGHGSEPHKVKINATLIMAKLLLELELLEKSWENY
jgi:acetylornithine deacetylase/succinyl-diaminopimelate desuccinylase-like protein